MTNSRNCAIPLPPKRRIQLTERWRGVCVPNAPPDQWVDLLCRKAGSRMQMGGSFPETFVSIFSLQNASLFHTRISLELASVRGNRGLADAAGLMGRLLGR